MATAVSGTRNSFAAIFGSLARLFETASDGPVAVRRYLGEYTRMAADQVLASEDRYHLSARIDALSGDNDLWDDVSSAAHRAIEMKVVTPPQDGVGKLDMKSLNGILGPTAASRCESGHAALSALAIEFKNMASIAGYEKAAPEETERSSSKLSGMSDVLYDRETPLVVRKVVASFLRSLTSALVIARAEERGERLSAWLAFALAEEFAIPFEEALSAITQPNAFRNIAAAIGEDEHAQSTLSAAFENWRECAAAAGDAVYFPVDYEKR